MRKARISTVWKDNSDKPMLTFAKVLQHCRAMSVEPLFATNAGIFTPGMAPGGLYVESGEIKVPINRNDGEGNFHLKPNGVFFIDADGAHVKDTEQIDDEAIKKMTVATQSGPLLAGAGMIHPEFRRTSENKKVRSGVGVSGHSKVCFALSKEAVNFHHFARLFVERLQCNDALYLDGVISRFWLPDKPEFQGGIEQFAAMFVVTPR